MLIGSLSKNFKVYKNNIILEKNFKVKVFYYLYRCDFI